MLRGSYLYYSSWYVPLIIYFVVTLNPSLIHSYLKKMGLSSECTYKEYVCTLSYYCYCRTLKTQFHWNLAYWFLWIIPTHHISYRKIFAAALSPYPCLDLTVIQIYMPLLSVLNTPHLLFQHHSLFSASNGALSCSVFPIQCNGKCNYGYNIFPLGQSGLNLQAQEPFLKPAEFRANRS